MWPERKRQEKKCARNAVVSNRVPALLLVLATRNTGICTLNGKAPKMRTPSVPRPITVHGAGEDDEGRPLYITRAQMQPKWVGWAGRGK